MPKTFDDLSKAERIKLILTDSQAYIDLVPGERWLGVLDGIAKVGPYEPLEGIEPSTASLQEKPSPRPSGEI